MNANIRNYCITPVIKKMTLRISVLAMLATLIITNIPDLKILQPVLLPVRFFWITTATALWIQMRLSLKPELAA